MDEKLLDLCKRAQKVKYDIQKLTSDRKNEALIHAARRLIERSDEIISANHEDIVAGTQKGMNEGLLDRLRLDEKRITGIAEGLKQVAALDDPVGKTLEQRDLNNGLHLRKVSVPMGVIGIIYESRPNVTADAFSLCFKAGSAVILKGGSDAINSNRMITSIIKDALKDLDIPEDAILLIESTDREVTRQFMTMKEYVDLLIPRGGAGLIRSVVENSLIPVIETGTGNCHIFVDKSADFNKAVEVILNAKTQRIGVCNAMESLIVHSEIVDEFMPLLAKALKTKNVEIRADQKICNIIDCKKATEEDYATEYLDLILSAKTVDNIDEAIEHVNRYTTHHSESILTSDKDNAVRFQNEVDAACVYVNCSTRFTDGFEFGLGAEIGISTQKLHARGPMGLKEITSYKYLIDGNYDIRS